MQFSTFPRIVAALLFAALFPLQVCVGQQYDQQDPQQTSRQADAAFASYSEEVLSSSRRQIKAPSVPTDVPSTRSSEMESNAQTGGLALSATNAVPALQSPPGAASSTPEFAGPIDFASSLDTGELLKKFVAGIVLSVSLCFALLFMGSKLKPQRAGGVGGSSEMQLVDTLHVGQRCCLQLVQVKDRMVIIGRDASGIREIVPLSTTFEDGLNDVDRETSEFEKAAEALLAQKGVSGWNRAKLRA